MAGWMDGLMDSVNDLLKAYSPVNRAGSPRGLSLNQILQKLDIQYKTCTCYKHKTYKHNPKVSPFGIALIKKRQIKLRHASTTTTDRFCLHR